MLQKRANGLLLGGIAGETLKWRLHPLIHTYEKAGCQVNKRYQLPTRGPQIGLIAKHLFVITSLGVDLVQYIDSCHRFNDFGSVLPQTGHTFSLGLTIKASLHLVHLTGWVFIRLISSGSRPVTAPFSYCGSNVFPVLG
jgi:hypothetical protein